MKRSAGAAAPHGGGAATINEFYSHQYLSEILSTPGFDREVCAPAFVSRPR